MLGGLFRVVERIYGVTIHEAKASPWHPSVRFFRVRDRDGALQVMFYFDLYAREASRRAWMDDAINRVASDAGSRSGRVHDVQPFAASGGKQPSSARRSDHAVTSSDMSAPTLTVSTFPGYRAFSVEWDASSCRRNSLNFCWEWNVLSQMTAHADPGRAIARALRPDDRGEEFPERMAMVRQLEFALFDMLLHDEYDPETRRPWASPQALLRPFGRKSPSCRAPSTTASCRRHTTFRWAATRRLLQLQLAESYSADAYSLFEEEGCSPLPPAPSSGTRSGAWRKSHSARVFCGL